MLVSRGYRVATIKHHRHDQDIDVQGKDSWRHAKAGARVTVVSGANQIGLFRKTDRELPLDELLRLVEDADIVLTEGYRQEGSVLIEISRSARSGELLCSRDELFALVTDGTHDVGDVPVFGLDDIAGLSDLIESTFLGPTRSRG